MFITYTYFILSVLLIAASLLPLSKNQHWFFRASEFGRIQLSVLLILVFILGYFLVPLNQATWITQIILGGCFALNAFILFPYLKPKKRLPQKHLEGCSRLSILSVNVYQFNDQYQRLIDLISDVKPDIFLTMESNQSWENALSVFDEEYPFHSKNGLENTYGLHFYSKRKAEKITVHHFVSEDLPSVEAEFKLQDGRTLSVYAVHPPPPSPTEEETSKERDGELMVVAKRIRNSHQPTVVVGDFNTVAWSNAATLFRKTSGLIDARIGKGFVSTFHAKYRLLRFPIDLFFHSSEIVIDTFKTLRPIGSDHLPVYAEVVVTPLPDLQLEEVEVLEEEELSEVDELIREGKSENGNRPEIAEE